MSAASILGPLPMSPSLLERYRIKSRRHYRPGLVGGHITRRKGQSLEFRDFSPYNPGDDIRHVDWRASARFGGEDDLLVKSFMAEERMTLVASVDTRDTMRFPPAMPKLLIAAWLAEAVARIAAKSGDSVILHRLFGDPREDVIDVRRGFPAGRSLLQSFADHGGPMNRLNLDKLDRYLPPTAVWLIITDLYFDPESGKKLLRRIDQARDGLRWIVLVDLDSWPHEKAVLGRGPREIEGPGLVAENAKFDIDGEGISKVEREIREHKKPFFKVRAGYDAVSWKWGPGDPDPASWFAGAFLSDRTLMRLFMKEA